MGFDFRPSQNDPGDPGHDMSAWSEYDGGALTFSYRRKLGQPAVDSGAGEHVDEWGEEPGADDGDGDGGEDEIEGTRGEVAVAGDPTPLERVVIEAGHEGRELQSATESDWRNRMVFYQGDERAFYQGLTGRACDPTSAIFDPACRTSRRTHREVAYNGYGTFRGGEVMGIDCEESAAFHGHVCTNNTMIPARLVIESMDGDHQSRSLTPVALATGGYVDLITGGWSHTTTGECGGYECVTRLMTFHTTIAVNRSYDLAFTATNPLKLRLMMPSGSGHHQTHHPEGVDPKALETRVIISIFYSNPQRLKVYWMQQYVPPLEHWYVHRCSEIRAHANGCTPPLPTICIQPPVCARHCLAGSLRTTRTTSRWPSPSSPIRADQMPSRRGRRRSPCAPPTTCAATLACLRVGPAGAPDARGYICSRHELPHPNRCWCAAASPGWRSRRPTSSSSPSASSSRSRTSSTHTTW